MVLQLDDIKGFKPNLSCTITMLCAISGLTPEEAALELQKAAKQLGVSISAAPRNDYDINHWLRAVTNLGGEWQEADNVEDWNFGDRPDIDEWMKIAASKTSLQLVFCDDNGDIGHTFATFKGDVVDTYTKGKRIKFIGVPEAYKMLRVKRSFNVRKPPQIDRTQMHTF